MVFSVFARAIGSTVPDLDLTLMSLENNKCIIRNGYEFVCYRMIERR